jgi:type IV secretory pathway VirB10-like protein
VQVSGIRIVARGAFASVCALSAFAPLVGVAAAQEVTTPPEVTTTSTVVEEPVITPPPTQPEQPPPTEPEQPPSTTVTTTTPPTDPPTTTTTTTQRPTTTTTQRPTTTTTSRSGTTQTTARQARPAPVIVFPTKEDGAVPTSTSAPGAATEPKTAVKTIPGAPGTTTTSEDREEARVAGRSEDRGNGTGDLASGAFEDSSSSLLPSSTLGAVLLVALVGFLTGGVYCGWLLVFARH